MKQIVYVDVLISVNLIINYFILLSTSKFLDFNTKRKRLILSASLASLYSLYIFAPKINFLLSLIIKLIMSLSIVALAFGIKNKKNLLKSLFCFYSGNFAFCGVILSVWYIWHSDKLIVKNGIAYIDISPTFLLTSTVISYIVIRAINFLVGRQKPKNTLYDIKLENNNKSSKLRAKLDTGHSLKEPFSNKPVIVTEYKYVKDIVPPNFLNTFNGLRTNTKNIQNLDENINFRMIPFKNTSSTGLLPAFKPDTVTIYNEKSSFKKDAYIAVCEPQKLGGEFEALISPELVET